MGGTSLFADLFRNCTTVLSMPFTDGFSISDSPIMIEYMNSKSEDAQRMEAYLAEENQAMVHFEFEQIIRPSLLHHSRKEFNLPDDGFLVTIVGNRLSFEITKEFIQILNDILMIDPNIYLVFIGDINMLAEVDNKRAFFLGLQKDLIGVLSLMDLFVNPPRKGGGTGAYWSLFNSVPVVTLGFCDVANCVNADFICKDEEDIVRRVERHFKDRQYHEAMKRKSKDIINEIEKKNDLRKNIETMINNVKTLEIQNHRK
jgi:glycosyltransferase involved in cell wall biosynthesis